MAEKRACRSSHSRTSSGSCRHSLGLGQQGADAIGEKGRKRHLPAGIGGNFRLAAGRRPRLHDHVADAREGQAPRPRRRRCRPASALARNIPRPRRGCVRPAGAADALHLKPRGLHDDADVLPVPRGPWPGWRCGSARPAAARGAYSGRSRAAHSRRRWRIGTGGRRWRDPGAA